MVKIMKVSDVINVYCSDLNHNGLGVCKIDGYPLFVQGILIGEEGKVEITKINKNFGYGQLIKITKPSPERVKPICPIFGICGGCDIMHLNYKAQLEYKLKSANETLKRLGKIDFEIKKIIGMEEPYYYRNKVQIPYQMRDGKVICGFFKKGTHDVVEFSDCFIQPKQSTEIAILIKNLANQYGITAYNEKTRKGNLRHVLIRNTVNDDYMVVLITNENKLPHSEKIVSRIVEKYPNVKTIIQNINNKDTNVILGDEDKLLFGKETLVENIMGLDFILSYRSFFQTNHTQTEKLYSQVLEYANPKKDEVIVDGYCGVGTISLMLAKHAKHVYGIEIVEDAINDAKENTKLNKIDNATFILGKTEEEIKKFTDQKIDTIVVDPPRKGCDQALLDSIMEMEIEKIVYVSCNIATLARDLSILEAKYEINDITVFDMFPQSAHVEVCVLLELK